MTSGDCAYILKDGTRIELMHHPGRKRPVIRLLGPDGTCQGHAVFHGEDDMAAFEAALDDILRPRPA